MHSLRGSDFLFVFSEETTGWKSEDRDEQHDVHDDDAGKKSTEDKKKERNEEREREREE